MFGSGNSPLFGDNDGSFDINKQLSQFRPDTNEIVPGIPVTADLFGLGAKQEGGSNNTGNLFFLGSLGSVLLAMSTKDKDIKNVSFIVAAVLALAAIMRKPESPMAPEPEEPPQDMLPDEEGGMISPMLPPPSGFMI